MKHPFSSFLILPLLAAPLLGDSRTVTIANDELSVTFSEIGAELQSIRHLPTDTEYLWQGDPEYWEGRAPNMFPVNVRFKDNRFAYLGDDYEMPRMGLAVAAEFKAEGTSENRTSLVMESSDDTLVHYPFPFRLEIVGEVNGLTLKQTYTVTNTGDEALYFALGGHPGFRAPFIHGRDRSDYEIRFADKLTVEREVVSDSLLTGERVSFLRNEDRFSLDDPRIPDGGMFLRDQPSPQISLALKGRSPYVTLDLDDFPNVNLWSPPGMPYACFEPMLGHHDLANTPEAIEEKEYLIHLPAGESRSYQFSIAIHPSEGELALN